MVSGNGRSIVGQGPSPYTLGIIAQGIGSASMGASASGHAYGHALRDGYSEEQARCYGTLVGASEAGLQYLLGGISKLGGVGSDVLLSSMAGKIASIDNALLRIAAETGIRMGSESLEESLQEFLEPALAILILDEEYDVNFDDVAYSFLLGALSAAVVGGGSSRSTDLEMVEYSFDIDNATMTDYSDSSPLYISGQMHSELASLGEAKILAGEMPTPAELFAMNMSEPEALGMMAVLQMDQADSAPKQQYTADDTLKNHIEYADPSTPKRRGIGGAHNKVEFMRNANEIKIVSSTPHTQIHGIETIRYYMPKYDKTGAPIPGEFRAGNPLTKTVYDPNMINSDEYIQRGMEAANRCAREYLDGVLPEEWIGYDNQGVLWRGYCRNGKIVSFFPD